MEEIWKDIEGYEGLYQISNTGNVKSLNYNKTKKERLLKPFKNIHNNFSVGLSKNKKNKQYSITSLINSHFPKIEYKNKFYKSKADLARAYGLTPDQLFNRLNDGWSLEQALEIPIAREKHILNVKLYKYNGKIYSMGQLAKISGLNRNCIERRIKRGWSVEEAVDLPSERSSK